MYAFVNISDAEIGQAEVIKEVIAKVREHVGPVASFKDVIIVPRLPKTRSGKIARNTLAAIAAGQPYNVCIDAMSLSASRLLKHRSDFHLKLVPVTTDNVIIPDNVKTTDNLTRICAAEMAVRYAALSACRKVHP